jgi:hypothetical protein
VRSLIKLPEPYYPNIRKGIVVKNKLRQRPILCTQCNQETSYGIRFNYTDRKHDYVPLCLHHHKDAKVENEIFIYQQLKFYFHYV